MTAQSHNGRAKGRTRIANGAISAQPLAHRDSRAASQPPAVLCASYSFLPKCATTRAYQNTPGTSYVEASNEFDAQLKQNGAS